MEFYVLSIDEKSYSALKRKSNGNVEVFEFDDITDLIPDKIKVSPLKVKLPVLEDGDPNEGITKPSRFYFSNPIRVSKRPYHNRDRILGKYAVEYAIGKKENIKELFDVDLDFNTVAIFLKESILLPEYEDWRINLQCMNMEGDLNLLEEREIKKFSGKDFY